MRGLVVVSLWLVTSAAYAGSFRPGVVAEVGAYGASGYVLPWIGGGLSIDATTGPLVWRAQALYSDTDKNCCGSAWELYGRAHGLLRRGRRSIGVGAAYNDLVFESSGYHRRLLHLTVLAGYRRVLASWTFPAPGIVGDYKTYRGTIAGEWWPQRHLGLTWEVSYVSLESLWPRDQPSHKKFQGLESGLFVRIR